MHALLLAAVLLAAQALGLAHGVAHGAASGAAHSATTMPHEAGGFNGHAAGGTECGLFSQMLGQALLPQAGFLLPAPPAPAAAVAALPALPHRAHAGPAYLARAPPRC